MRRAGLLWVAMIGLGGCAHAPASSGAGNGAPRPDSVTVALWHMDEAAGTRITDSGRSRLDGIAGRDVTRPFGRFNGGLGFSSSLDSFVFAPFDPAMEPAGGLSIEAWLYPTAFGSAEDTPIVARWTEEANKQSWIFSIAGSRIYQPTSQGTGFHATLFPDVEAGKLLFAYQPSTAGLPRAYVSTRALALQRWTHVAVTFDGLLVRFYIDGDLDSQFASRGSIRSSTAPYLIGNYFDVRLLTGFGGDLHPETLDPTAFYAYQGSMDELRISRVARQDFPAPAPR
jgi:hypothetical protein